MTTKVIVLITTLKKTTENYLQNNKIFVFMYGWNGEVSKLT
jgi:hypothetical protein